MVLNSEMNYYHTDIITLFSRQLLQSLDHDPNQGVRVLRVGCGGVEGNRKTFSFYSTEKCPV